jgi:hypothetical protein
MADSAQYRLQRMVPQADGKVPCRTCDAEILPSTAQKYGGLCKPCATGTRDQVDAAKAWYLEPREEKVQLKKEAQPRRPPRSKAEYPSCPACRRSDAVLPVRYGFGPAATPMGELLPNGRGFSGGHCSISPEQPAWQCGVCRSQFGRLDEEPEYDFFFADE